MKRKNQIYEEIIMKKQQQLNFQNNKQQSLSFTPNNDNNTENKCLQTSFIQQEEKKIDKNQNKMLQIIEQLPKNQQISYQDYANLLISHLQSSSLKLNELKQFIDKSWEFLYFLSFLNQLKMNQQLNKNEFIQIIPLVNFLGIIFLQNDEKNIYKSLKLMINDYLYFEHNINFEEEILSLEKVLNKLIIKMLYFYSSITPKNLQQNNSEVGARLHNDQKILQDKINLKIQKQAEIESQYYTFRPKINKIKQYKQDNNDIIKQTIGQKLYNQDLNQNLRKKDQIEKEQLKNKENFVNNCRFKPDIRKSQKSFEKIQTETSQISFSLMPQKSQFQLKNPSFDQESNIPQTKTQQQYSFISQNNCEQQQIKCKIKIKLKNQRIIQLNVTNGDSPSKLLKKVSKLYKLSQKDKIYLQKQLISILQTVQ